MLVVDNLRHNHDWHPILLSVAELDQEQKSLRDKIVKEELMCDRTTVPHDFIQQNAADLYNNKVKRP